MKIRKHDWFNRKNNQIMYGIQGQIEPRGCCFNLCEGLNPCIYETEAERDAKMREISTATKVKVRN